MTLDYESISSQFGRNAQLMLRFGDEMDLAAGDGRNLGPPQLEAGGMVHVLNQSGVKVQLGNGRPWTNPLNSADVNYDNEVDPLDALRIINLINRGSAGDLAAIDSQTDIPLQYYDTTGDSSVGAIDALRVINALAREQPTGNQLTSGETPAVAAVHSTTLEAVHDAAVLALTQESELDSAVATANAAPTTNTDRYDPIEVMSKLLDSATGEATSEETRDGEDVAEMLESWLSDDWQDVNARRIDAYWQST